MTFSTTYAASEHINRYHVRFADKCTLPKRTNPNAFDVLMRARDYIKSSAATGFTFPATLDDGTKTEIEMNLVGDDGWSYIERPGQS